MSATASTTAGGELATESGAPIGRVGRASREERLGGGWRIVAVKELGDHVASVRFFLLLIVVSLAGVASVYATAGSINDIVGSGPKSSSLFLYLFTGVPAAVDTSNSSLPSFVTFIGILGPLLGIAFGFDAISAERSRRTLPRLVSQPIHRDDVITGKFVAGLGAIALVLGTLTAVVAGIGMLRLGLVPSLADATRVVAFVVVALVYIGVWLGLAILASLLFREASTAALTTMAIWMVFTLFLGLITGAVADRFKEVSADASTEPELYAVQIYDNAKLDDDLQRVSPARMYDDAAGVILNPFARTTSAFIDPIRADRAIPSALPLSESLVIAFTPIAVLAGLTVVIFAAAYIAFLRQEVRA